MRRLNILLVEDDAVAASYLRQGLSESGHAVDHAADGQEGLTLARSGDYDVLIIDRMLPGRDGTSIVSALRQAGSEVPILLLTALGEVDDRVSGLRAGADDYLPKPYAFAELLARLETITRRHAPEVSAHLLRVADLEIDTIKRTVTRAGRTIRLQPREFRLLEHLMRHAGEVLTRSVLLEKVWEYRFDPQTNVVDAHISRLRSKIDKDFAPPLLITVRGAGYSLREPE